MTGYSIWLVIYSRHVTYTVNILRDTSCIIHVGNNNMWKKNRCPVKSHHEISYASEKNMTYGIIPNYTPHTPCVFFLIKPPSPHIMWLGVNNLRAHVFQGPLPMRESEGHPQIVTNVSYVWWLDLGIQKRGNAGKKEKNKNVNVVDILALKMWPWD